MFKILDGKSRENLVILGCKLQATSYKQGKKLKKVYKQL